MLLLTAEQNHKCQKETSAEVWCHLSILPADNHQHKLGLIFSHHGEKFFFTSPLHTPCLFIFVCWSRFSFSRSTFNQYLLWCRCPWSLATNTMRKWEAVLPCPRASECPEAHEAPGGIRAARTGTRCSLVLVHRMGNPCSSGILGAGESCSCSRSDGTFYFWIFAVREGWRQLWKLFLLTADSSGSRSLFREADIFVRHLQV